MFGHLLLDGERTATIESIDFFNHNVCSVAVNFQPCDGPENPPGKIVHYCLFFDEKPTEIPGGFWQYCYPQ